MGCRHQGDTWGRLPACHSGSAGREPAQPQTDSGSLASRRSSISSFAIAILVACVPLFAGVRHSDAASPSDFEHDVAPILVNRCLECHHRGKTSGGLNLATADGILRGGDTGPAIDEQKPAESLLLARVKAGEMPPKENGKRESLTAAELSVLQEWIVGGAEWPKSRELGLHEQKVSVEEARDFWAYQPVRRPIVPKVAQGQEPQNPIDAFIEEKLNAAAIQRSPVATPRQLLRRAWLDLVGLPPSLADQRKLSSHQTLDDYSAMIDRLLDHQGYGERWARYWLDLVRYADSNGYERDGGKPSVWRYRDYVIKSLNDDKPYNRFVLEQLAGDELDDRTAETVIATGFHALGTWQDEVDPLEAAQYRADELDDMLRTTAQTFLAVTIGCARCHNHKFDPISMVDYYSLSAILSPLNRPNAGRQDRDFPAGSLAELEALRIRDKKVDDLKRHTDELRSLTEKEWLDAGKSKLPTEAVEAFRAAAPKRDPKQNQLVQKHQAEWNAEVTAAHPTERQEQISENEKAIQKLRHETPDLPRGYFLFEATQTPPPTHLLLSGRASNLGPQMQPAVPVVLTQTQPSFGTTKPNSSGRRLALAQWIIDPHNPLTARVIVNRVWQHHFGEGLVATPSDFGHIGARPTHPELLDWLADWFVNDAGWSLKKLHKLIMTSRTYRTLTAAEQDQLKSDPENKLLSHFPLKRLDVETIRDAILSTSGKLNPEMYGPAVFLPIAASVVEAHTDKEAAWQTSPEPAIYRRTIYAYVKRTLLVPMLEVLDLCDTTNSTEKRSITSIAPQALTLYNGDFVNQQAAFFADRIVKEVGSDPAKQIERAYELALCRRPTDKEVESLTRFLADEASPGSSPTHAESYRTALTQVCRVILNLNEFVYVE